MDKHIRGIFTDELLVLIILKGMRDHGQELLERSCVFISFTLVKFVLVKKYNSFKFGV